MRPIKLSTESSLQLVQFLSSIGAISTADASNALISSEESKQEPIETLIRTGKIDELQVARAVASTYGLEFVHLKSENDVDEDVFERMPFNFILRHRVIPFRQEQGEIHVAIADNSTLNIISTVQTILNSEIKAYVMPLSEMNNILTAYQDSHPIDVKVLEEEIDEEVIAQDSSEASSSMIINFVNKIITEAVDLGASDIHLEKFRKFSRLRYRVDGVLTAIDESAEIIDEFYSAITTRIKIMSLLDIAERRLPQDGAMSLEIKGRDVDFRVSILPTGFGERVVLRILDRSSISLTIDKLCLSEADEKALIHAVESPQGLVLVTGPTGSGKSTTLYAVLDRINKVGVNIMTAEDPVEYSIDGIGQVQIKENIGLTFSVALRSFLRQDPEVIMVGEIRDKETVDIAVKSALTGHLVLSTLHTNDSVSAISRLLNMGVPTYLVTSAVTLVMAQRLIRLICLDCRTKDLSVTRDQLQVIGFSVNEGSMPVLYKGDGCNSCYGTGVKGRRGLYEVLRMTNNLKEGIHLNKTTVELLEIAETKDGFRTMQKTGRDMLIEGLLSFEEFQRVIMVL